MKNIFAIFCLVILAFVVVTGLFSCSYIGNFDGEKYDSIVTEKGKNRIVDYYNSGKKLVMSKSYYLDTVNNIWIITSFDQFSYNSFNKISTQKFHVLDMELKMKPLQLDSFFYDSIGLPVEKISFVLSSKSGTWTNFKRQDYTYRENDTNVFRELIYLWNLSQKDWNLGQEIYYGYDSLGRNVSRLVYEIDPHDTTKVKKDFQEYYYPSDF